MADTATPVNPLDNLPTKEAIEARLAVLNEEKRKLTLLLKAIDKAGAAKK